MCVSTIYGLIKSSRSSFYKSWLLQLPWKLRSGVGVSEALEALISYCSDECALIFWLLLLELILTTFLTPVEFEWETPAELQPFLIWICWLVWPDWTSLLVWSRCALSEGLGSSLLIKILLTTDSYKCVF